MRLLVKLLVIWFQSHPGRGWPRHEETPEAQVPEVLSTSSVYSPSRGLLEVGRVTNLAHLGDLQERQTYPLHSDRRNQGPTHRALVRYSTPRTIAPRESETTLKK